MSIISAINELRSKKGQANSIDPDVHADILKEIADSLSIYHFNRGNDILNVGEVDQTLAEINIVDLTQGVFELIVSVVWDYDNATNSIILTYTDPSGVTEVSYEPKDRTDKNILTYVVPYSHSGGDFGMKIEGRKEVAAGTFNVYTASVSARLMKEI